MHILKKKKTLLNEIYTFYGCLNENGPLKLLCLNTWSLGGGTVWEGSGGWPCWNRCVTRGQGWRFYKTLAIPSVPSLLPNCRSRCELSAISATMPLLHHHGFLPSKITSPIKCFFFVSCLSHGVLPQPIEK